MGLKMKIGDDEGNSLEIHDTVERPQAGDIATLRFWMHGRCNTAVLNRPDMLEMHRAIGEILNAQPIEAIEETQVER